MDRQPVWTAQWQLGSEIVDKPICGKREIDCPLGGIGEPGYLPDREQRITGVVIQRALMGAQDSAELDSTTCAGCAP